MRKNLSEIIEVYKNSDEFLQKELDKDLDLIYKKIHDAAQSSQKRAVVEQTFFRHLSQRYARIDGLNIVIKALEVDGYTLTIGSEQISISGWTV